MSADAATLAAIISAVAALEADDPVVFDPSTLKLRAILETAAYPGFRAEMTARIGTAREKLVLDISTGNAITPEPIWLKFPNLTGGAPVAVMGDPLETIVAEKTAAAVELQLANTRLKDFYDLHRIVATSALDPVVLRRALQRTFERRGTRLADCAGTLERLSVDEQLQARWQAFLRQNDLQAPVALASALAPAIAVLSAALGQDQPQARDPEQS